MDQADVIIAGGGLVGLALAAALDSSGLRAIVVDPADPAPRNTIAFDGRTTAVSSSSMRMFEAIGVTVHICPSRAARSAESRSPTGSNRAVCISMPTMTKRSAGCTRIAICAPRFWRGPRPARHIALNWKTRIVDADRGEHGVAVRLDDGRTLRAPLLVACDGRNSALREDAAIPLARWKYEHHAIVSVLRHERPHDHVAYEIFYPVGPVRLAADDRR